LTHIHLAVFDAVETEFISSPVASETLVQQDECGHGLPDAIIGVREARAVVTDPAASLAVRDAIWATLVRRVRVDPDLWQLAAIWMMLPSLRAITNRLHRTWGVDRQDVQSDVILGFIEALRAANPARRKLGPSLWWATYRHGRHACQQATRDTASEDIDIIAARREMSDHSTDPPAEPLHSGIATSPPTDNPVTHTHIEGERLGAIAYHLALRERTRGHCQTRTTRRSVSHLTLRDAARSRGLPKAHSARYHADAGHQGDDAA
jgi:hypothetical protein